MATRSAKSLSINILMGDMLRGTDALYVSTNKVATYAKKIEKINLFKATKFTQINAHLKSTNDVLAKIQARTAKISRQPLSNMNAKKTRDDLKTRLRYEKAIGNQIKQNGFYAQKASQSQRAKGFLGSRAKMAGAMAGGAMLGGLASLNPVRKAIDFETSMADVTKATNANKAQTALLKKNILKQVKNGSLLSASEIAQIQAGGGRSGVGISFLSQFTKDIAEASVAMDLATSEAGRDFAKMAERMDLPIAKINIMTNAFTHLENNGANSARDMINTTGRLSSIFKELKFTPQNSASMSNYMNTLEVSPELAASSFKILTNRFKKTNSEFNYFTRLQTKGAGELKNIINDIISSMSSEQIIKTFGAQGANVITKMSGNLKNLDKSLKLVSGNSFMSAVGNEMKVKLGTTGATEKMAQNRIEGGSIVMGDQLKHQYVGFLNLLSNGITKVTAFYKENEKLINTFGSMALKLLAVGAGLKAIAFMASPFALIFKSAFKLKGALVALKGVSNIPIKTSFPATAGMLGKFKGLLGTLLSFAKRNPIVLGATVVAGGAMLGLNHMAKNAQPLAQRQEQKGVGLALRTTANNGTLATMSSVPKKLGTGYTLADQLGGGLPVESAADLTASTMQKMQTQTTHNNQQTHQVFNNTFNVTSQAGEVPHEQLAQSMEHIQRQAKHTEQDLQLADTH